MGFGRSFRKYITPRHGEREVFIDEVLV